METTTENKVFTKLQCRITIVDPGRSDAVIKVFPAEVKEEKIWLDNTQGIERWAFIKRMMEIHSKARGSIPAPLPYHADPQKLSVITLKEDDIPLVELEGYIIPKPPEEPKEKIVVPITEKQIEDRFVAIENKQQNIESKLDQLINMASDKKNK